MQKPVLRQPTLPLWTCLALPIAWGLLLFACKQWCDVKRSEVI